ncbi:MAG TPA: GNAT family N-acetyltransferase [Anaerolineales bacterium]|nr:GNAT family N-acetyltransferase [Anaerolineales bacterium]
MAKFRPMNLMTDAADMARLYSYTVPEPVTVETVRDWWALRAGEIRVTTLAFDKNSRAVGYWDVDRETWMRPGHFYIKVIVQPEARGHGLGTQMYNDAQRVAVKNGATHLKSSVGDMDINSLKFAVKRGFKIERHTFESTLQIADFDERRFNDLTALLLTEGFRFFSLAEAGLTDENKHKLYELNRDAGLDNPGNDGIFPDFHAFSRNVFEASWFRADTQIIASCADKWVGLAAIGIYPADNRAYNMFTGVLREYRGRGLAQALKLQTILLAKKEGVRYVRTHNDSKNRSMLSVNRKLGYRPEPGQYQLLCVPGETRGNSAASA